MAASAKDNCTENDFTTVDTLCICKASGASEENEITQLVVEQPVFKSDVNGSVLSVEPHIQICNDDRLTIYSLPCEILEYIFSFLGIDKRIEVELVCKYWRWMGKTRAWSWPQVLTVSDEEDGNSTPNVLCSESVTDSVLLDLLSRCGRCVRHLTLRQDKYTFWNSERAVKIVGEFCPNLQSIALHGIGIDYQKDVHVMSIGCAKLQSVKIHEYYYVTDEEIDSLLSRCSKLECLDVSCRGSEGVELSGKSFYVLNDHCRTLRLYRCVFLDAEDIEHLVVRCNFVQDLRLTYCDCLSPDALLKVLHHYQSTLTTLFLDGYLKVINWCEALQCLHRLERLSLYCCSQVDDELCMTLVRNCVNIRALNVSCTSVTDVGLKYLASAPCLIEVDVTCLKLSGFGIEILAAQKRLEIVYAKFVDGLTNADETFIFLASVCPNLKILDVSGIEDLSTKLVDSYSGFLKSGQLKGPVRLGLEFTRVDHEGFFEGCDGLELLFYEVKSLYNNEDYKFDEEDLSITFENSYDSEEEDYDAEYLYAWLD